MQGRMEIGMTLISVEFIVFFIAALIVYYIIPKSGQWILLLLASLAFFLLAGTPYTIVYLLASIISVYLACRIIEKQENRKKKKAAFIAAVILNIGMLAALKYTDFLLENVQGLINLFDTGISVGTTKWIASIGISFYTLQVIGYLCDVYWGISTPQRNPFKFALFISYFPGLTSGPISRYSQLSDQLYAKHSFDYETVAFGFQRILWGFAKKLIIAERLAPFVNTVYGDPGAHQGAYVWFGTIAFVLQLYADFSGNMDIISGVSECFGITLPANFKTPFFSRTVQEFWQRWHITLGTWFKDYVMFPILKSNAWTKTGKKLKAKFGKKAARMIPAFLGMLFLWVGIGLWHGGGWKYIVQGCWFWLVIVTGQLTAPLFGGIKGKMKEGVFWHLFQSIRTGLIFAVGLVFFRADNLTSAFGMLKSALTVFNPEVLFSGSFMETLGGWANLRVISAGLLLLIFVGVYQYRGHSVREWVGRKNIVFRWILYYILIFSILFWGMYGSGYNPADFIYGGF